MWLEVAVVCSAPPSASTLRSRKSESRRNWNCAYMRVLTDSMKVLSAEVGGGRENGRVSGSCSER